MVTRVILGEKAMYWEGPAVRRIRAYVAQLIGQPVEVVFPEYARHVAKKAAA